MKIPKTLTLLMLAASWLAPAAEMKPLLQPFANAGTLGPSFNISRKTLELVEISVYSVRNCQPTKRRDFLMFSLKSIGVFTLGASLAAVPLLAQNEGSGLNPRSECRGLPGHSELKAALRSVVAVDDA